MRRLLLLSEGGGAGKTFAAANLLPLLPQACLLELKSPPESDLALVTGKIPEALDSRSSLNGPPGRLFWGQAGEALQRLPPLSDRGWLLVDGLGRESPGWQAWLESCGCALLCARGDLQGARRVARLLRALEAAHFPRPSLRLAWTPSWPSQPLPEFPGITALALPEFAKAAERQAQSLLPSLSDPSSPLAKACRALAQELQSLPHPHPEPPQHPRAAMHEEILRPLLDEMRRRMDLQKIDSSQLAGPRFRELWEPRVREMASGLLAEGAEGAAGEMSRKDRAGLEEDLIRLLLGLGPLEELMQDEEVAEIMVNGPGQVYVERHGKVSLSRSRFWDEAQLLQVIARIVAPLGRRIDESSPKVDARLPDGSRVNAVIPPLSLKGPCLTIRRFPKSRLGMQALVGLGALSPQAAAFLKSAVELRKNIVVSGGTGSGKTTLLNALSAYIPEDERIITIEDAAELKLDQEHVVPLESRPKNMEGRGEVTIRDLVANALRMRPDRIVVGECRGGEALDMLQAMNTGHDGSLSTVHANSPRDALARLETLCLMSDLALPLAAVRRQLASAVELVVQVARLKDGSRRLTSIAEITGMEGDTILSQEIFAYDRGLKACGVVPDFYHKARKEGYELDFGLFSVK